MLLSIIVLSFLLAFIIPGIIKVINLLFSFVPKKGTWNLKTVRKWLQASFAVIGSYFLSVFMIYQLLFSKLYKAFKERQKIDSKVVEKTEEETTPGDGLDDDRKD